MDHRGAEFASIVKESLEGMRKIVQTRGPVVMYPASGSGAWEAAIDRWLKLPSNSNRAGSSA
jgi:alanine-glyoxylate transaminase/serine-glyoxylate transaminase/serine-pyruvate transaminase